MKSQRFYGSTALIAFATLLSRILGLVREQLFAYFFGAGLSADAFQIAFRIPNLLRDLFAEGAVSSALVPVYLRSRVVEGDESAWRLVNKIFFLLAILLVIVTTIGIIYANSLVHLYAGAFSLVPGKIELTVQLTRIIWPFLPCIAFAAVCMGVLNARERFAVPALASSAFNFLTIAMMLLLCPLLPHWGVAPIFGMAIAVLVGGVGQWLMQMPSLVREGFSYRIPGNLWDSRVREILWLMFAGTFALAATQINIVVNSLLAAAQGTGAVSWLHYAFRLMQFPIGIFGVAISTTTLTKVSKEVAIADFHAVRETLRNSLRMVMVLTIPSAVGLAILGVPIIAVIYEHGNFSPKDTYATATALAAYAIGLSAYSAIKVLVPVFYSLGKTKAVIWASLLSVLFNVLLCFALRDSLGLWGLPVSTSIASILHCVFLLWFLRRIVGDLDFGDLARCFSAALLCSALMGLVLFLFLNRVSLPLFAPIPLTGYWSEAKFSLRFMLLAAAMGVGAAVYMISSSILGIHEISRLKQFIWKQSS